MSELKPIAYYQGLLNDLRKNNPYAKNWKLEIVKKTNRHVDTSGHSWGWYEMFPLGIELGIWSRDSSDLACIDINEWNRRAQQAEEEEW